MTDRFRPLISASAPEVQEALDGPQAQAACWAPRLPRRALLRAAATAATSAAAGRVAAATRAQATLAGAAAEDPPLAPAPGAVAPRLRPVALADVRLAASPFRDALLANLVYLKRLEPDRLLHNYHLHAGLPPKAQAYGGWEGETIAGHTLGHYLSACALMHAQTGDAECASRVAYIVAELQRCQARAADGYVAGFTRRLRKGDAWVVENGRVVFEELARGEIRSAGFDLNGCWVPFYNWHKLIAGLLDAQQHGGSAQALGVALRLAGFIDTVFAKLDDAQVQQVLDCEHGGLNESMAELHARTGEPRWLRLAERIRHRRVLDPLAQGQDVLPGLHANTQIPKLIGLMRLYQLTGQPAQRDAAEFFWRTVTQRYSYAIGGNADREYFQAERPVAGHLTEQTCEGCNTYNMLKLTRLLYQQEPDARYFDYYERAHLNHVLAQQNPADGMFTYMMPMMAGAAREYSSPEADFWCCVGSGMESHAKHGDSAWWQGDRLLVLNLYIASTVQWRAQGVQLRLDTQYPFDGRVDLSLSGLRRPRQFALALRIPAWAQTPQLSLNDAPLRLQRRGGYAWVDRRWREGDRLRLVLPLPLRLEPAPDDERVVALLRGPLVMAADLGPASAAFDGPAPALVGEGEQILAALTPRAEPATLDPGSAMRPAAAPLRPFFAQHARRSAVYFRSFDEAGWQAERAQEEAEQARARALAARSVDVVYLGEMQSERDHRLDAADSYTLSYRGRNGRDIRRNGYIEFDMAARPGPLVLQTHFWGEDKAAGLVISVQGEVIARIRFDRPHTGAFFTLEHPLPAALSADQNLLRVRLAPEPGQASPPIFGCRLFVASEPAQEA